MSNVTLKASGDWSGAADTKALKAAIAQLTRPAGQRHSGIILLDGQFMVNEPLAFGTPDSCPIALHSLGHSQISWMGPTTDEPLLTFAASRQAHSRVALLSNVLVTCQNKDRRCRGVKFENLPHHLLMDNAEVLWWRGVGVDAQGCWCSGLRDSTILAGSGVALRATHFNNGYLQGLTIHGVAGDWPSDLDADKRAGLVLRGRGMVVESIELEGSRYDEYPLIYVSTGRTRIEGLWLESTRNYQAKIVAESDGVPPGAMQDLLITRVDGHCGGQPGSCRAFLELRGYSDSIEVADSLLTQLGTSVVYAASGQHTNVRVSRVRTALNAIPAASVLKAAPGATISTAPLVNP